jgi:hypothetical protein
MSNQTMMEELMEWLGSLSPEFAFLLALPFVVAAAAFAADWIRRGRSPRRRRHERRSRRSARNGHHVPGL